MKRITPAPARRRRALLLSAAAAAAVAALLGPGAGSALASTTASVQNGTLTVLGDGAADKLALRLDGSAPDTLQVDVGDDGTADFSFDRSTFTAISVLGPRRRRPAPDRPERRPLHRRGRHDRRRQRQRHAARRRRRRHADRRRRQRLRRRQPRHRHRAARRGRRHVPVGPGRRQRRRRGPGRQATASPFNGSNIAEHMEVLANGSRVLFTRDVAGITMDLNGIERLALRTLGGADTVFVGDLAGTALKTRRRRPERDRRRRRRRRRLRRRGRHGRGRRLQAEQRPAGGLVRRRPRRADAVTGGEPIDTARRRRPRRRRHAHERPSASPARPR